MNNDEVGLSVACFFIGALVMFLGMNFYSTPNHQWQKQAIDHGAAQYSPVTGKFEWKESDK